MSFKDKFKNAIDSLSEAGKNIDPELKEKIKQASEGIGAKILSEGIKLVGPMVEAQIRKRIREEIINKLGIDLPKNPIAKAGIEILLDATVAAVWEEIKDKIKGLKDSTKK